MGQDDPPTVPDQRDFFISYADPDQAWAEWIATKLEQRGYTVFLKARLAPNRSQ